MFDVKLTGDEDNARPVNLRLYLRSGDSALSETWIYQWSPPADRRF
jgi:periplasmic glucans biosynthesis protein